MKPMIANNSAIAPKINAKILAITDYCDVLRPVASD
jgi:hypothetical protein